MSEDPKDKKELATNRLLEILRGDRAENGKDDVRIKVDLTDDERTAIDAIQKQSIKDADSARRSKRVFSGLKRAAPGKSKSSVEKISDLLAIDIGESSVKYLYCSRIEDKIVLKDYGVTKIEKNLGFGSDASGYIKNIVRDLVTYKTAANFSLISVIDGSESGVGRVRIPVMPHKKIHSILKLTSAKVFNFSPENAIIDFLIQKYYTDGGIRKADIVAAAANKSFVKKHLKIFKQLSKKPDKILPVQTALSNSLKSVSERKDVSDVLVLDIGEMNSTAVFVDNGYVDYQVHFRFGGSDLTTALSGTYSTGEDKVSINVDEAEHIKKLYGIPDEDLYGMTENGIPFDLLSGRIKGCLDRFVDQIIENIEDYKAITKKKKLARIYICGGTANLKNVADFLAEKLNVNVEILDVERSIDFDEKVDREKFSEIKHVLVTAFGGIFSTSNDVSLLPGKIWKDKRKRFYKAVSPWAAAFMLLFLAYYTFIPPGNYSKIKSALSNLGEKIYSRSGDNLSFDDSQYTEIRVPADTTGSKAAQSEQQLFTAARIDSLSAVVTSLQTDLVRKETGTERKESLFKDAQADISRMKYSGYLFDNNRKLVFVDDNWYEPGDSINGLILERANESFIVLKDNFKSYNLQISR
jgi:type IV pilus assembly protein PilM